MNSITNIIKRTSVHVAKSKWSASAPVASLFTSKMTRQPKVQSVMTKGAKIISPDMTIQVRFENENKSEKFFKIDLKIINSGSCKGNEKCRHWFLAYWKRR